MNYKDLFKKDSNIMNKYYSMFEKNVKNLYTKDRAILDGEKNKYFDLINTKEMELKSKRPEIVINEMNQYFQRAVVWDNATTMINITPPVTNISLAASNFCNVYNPNFAQDESSGYLMTTELIVVKYLSQLFGWDWLKSRGIFTFGGKGTNMYAVKAALNKINPNYRQNGISSNNIIISNKNGHPCHIEICDWLGIGRNSCLRLDVNENGQLDPAEFELQLRKLLDQGKQVPCIILNGGTTNEVIVDLIKDIAVIRDRLVKEYQLSYNPHIHVDSVIGWAWIMFDNYDYVKNPLKMNDIDKQKIHSLCEKIKNIKYADSFGADFHKTGFSPYISSCVIFKNGQDLYGLGGREMIPYNDMMFGEYSPFEYSLELSRAATGAVSAYVNMETLGKEGFCELIYNIYKSGEYIRSLIFELPDFEVINPQTEGFATLFVIHKAGSSKKYKDYINSNDVDSFLKYNNDFFKFCIDMLEKRKTNVKFTFSKSYKPFGAKCNMGALKIYQTSPIVEMSEVKLCIDEIVKLKRMFDESEYKSIESKNEPIDFVYR